MSKLMQESSIYFETADNYKNLNQVRIHVTHLPMVFFFILHHSQNSRSSLGSLTLLNDFSACQVKPIQCNKK